MVAMLEFLFERKRFLEKAHLSQGRVAKSRVPNTDRRAAE